MTRVLLIGATGKVGRAVLKELVSSNVYEVALLVRNLSTRELDNAFNAKLFEGDLTVQETLFPAVEWADVLVNCSGYVSYRRNDFNKLHQLNVEAVKNLIYVCTLFQKKIIHTSTAGVYGSTKHPVYNTEEIFPEGSYKTMYFICKQEAEKLFEKSLIPYAIIRPGTLISREKSTLKNLYTFYKKGLIAGLCGGASFALMSDVAKAYIPVLKLLLQETENTKLVYNLGGNNLTFRQVFDTFKVVNDRKTVYLPNWVMYLLSLFNDFLLYPFFGKSLITSENYNTGNHFTFLDSTKAINDLNYNITPFHLSLKEVTNHTGRKD